MANGDKLRSWPRYVVWQWAASECPTYLLVVTPSRRVERWASKPIALGHPGFTLAPIVLGPSNVPSLRDRQERAQAPSSPYSPPSSTAMALTPQK